MKQKLFVKNYIENGFVASKAAKKSYNTKNNGKELGYELLHKENVKEELTKQLDKAGLSLEVLHNKSLDAINDGLNAKASFAAGINHLQFLYKLHNALPLNKSMRMNLNYNQNFNAQSMDQAVVTLQTLTQGSNKLLESLAKKKK